MLTHNHDNFPSDVYSMMVAAGATVTIATSAEESTSYSLQEFMRVAMDTKLIVSMEIPFLNGDVFRSYKVMPRAQVTCCCRGNTRPYPPSAVLSAPHCWTHFSLRRMHMPMSMPASVFPWTPPP